jgi:uncharacterized membrane protein YjjP (DUF1212 family)
MKAFFGGWSKKLTAFFVTVLVIILNKKLDLGLTEPDIYAVTGGLGAYAVGQGLTDLGKGKALVENGKAPTP